MSIWFRIPNIQQANKLLEGTLAATLGIKFAHIGDDFVVGNLLIDKKVVQSNGALHHGASVVLAESLADFAANACVDQACFTCCSLGVNASHVKVVESGTVTGMARPVHIGDNAQVWRVEMKDENDDLVCEARVTLTVSTIDN